MTHVLIADDDPHIVDVISFALEKAGMAFTVAKNGQEALDRFSPEKHDFIVLDIGMPELDGLEVCREIRKKSDVPILFLSARDEEIDRILGLEIGGDDYVTKPFSPRELVARIGVILKRTAKAAPETGGDDDELSKGLLRMDRAHRSASFNNQPLSMTAIEFNILSALLARPRMAFTREQLLDTAWPANIHVSDRTIDSHVRNLRAKLASVGCRNAVETVHGIGFRLGPCT
ncbi:MAG: response regulator transcription factor [Pseudomonadota bacterium]